MINKARRYLRTLKNLQRVSACLARGAASRDVRALRLDSPRTWEFAGFSQNGEDGVLEVLLQQMLEGNRYFVEIGASDGLENNTTWLSLVRRFNGLWIEGNPVTARQASEFFTPLAYGVEIREMFVTSANAHSIVELARYRDPDVLSLDIDSHDYFVLEALFDAGLTPKICVVEYNSAFGPSLAATVPEVRSPATRSEAGDNLYYGCSLAAWRQAFRKRGYRFVTVEQNGVNAFFVDPSRFSAEFLESLECLEFAENYSQRREYGTGWEKQFELIRTRPLVEVS